MRASFLVVLGSLLISSAGVSPGQASLYEALQVAEYRGPIPIPEQQLILEIEGARLILESGTISLLEPVASSVVTGLVFEGTGRIQLDIPDDIERRQLQRFARDEELERLDHVFRRAVVRTTIPDLVERLGTLPMSSAADRGAGALARRRHRDWVRVDNHDADGRVVASLLTFGERYLRADLDLEKHGWVTFDIDDRRREEIGLDKVVLANDPPMHPPIVESWLRLDRQRDRLENGRPGERLGGFSQVKHVDASVELLELGRNPARGFGDVLPLDAAIEAEVELESNHDGLGAVVLRLHPLADIESVQDAAGRPAELLRFATHELSSHYDRRLAGLYFTVILPEPLAAGERTKLHFRYRLELGNFAAGAIWYPISYGRQVQLHTADLRFEHRQDYGVVVSGRKVEEWQDGRLSGSRWRTARPTSMVGFTFAQFPHTAYYQWEGLPKAVLFGTQRGYLSAPLIEELAPRLEKSLRCLTEMLDAPLEINQLTLSLITSRHGQAFEGFLQIDDMILAKGGPGRAIHGTKELFIGHEVAHQWWGHQVLWDSYRDQWLSESLAEYTAALCVGRTVDDGDKVFRRILDAYTDEVVGSLGGAFNAFARPGLSLRNDFSRERIGPIAHGTRSRTRHAPAAFLTTAYRKGALVLHMVAERLRLETGQEDAFEQLLRELLRRHGRDRISTADLVALLEDVVDEDWAGFFERWVEEAAIPEWKVATRLMPRGAGSAIEVSVEQQGVSEDFVAKVPVRTTSVSGEVHERLFEISQGMNELSFESEERIRKVEVNPDHAVLARTRGTLARRGG